MKKRKMVINLRDARVIYVFLLLTWFIVLADGIIIHGMARDRIKAKDILEEKTLINAVRNRITELDVDKIQSIQLLSQKLTDHKCSLHYGGNKCH